MEKKLEVERERERKLRLEPRITEKRGEADTVKGWEERGENGR